MNKAKFRIQNQYTKLHFLYFSLKNSVAFLYTKDKKSIKENYRRPFYSQ